MVNRVKEKDHLFFKEVIEQMEDGVIAYDAKDDTIYLNQLARELHGEKKESFKLKDFFQEGMYLNKEKMKMKQGEIPIFRVLSGDTLNHEEFWLNSKDGNIYNLLACGNRIVRNNEILGAVVSIHDNTQYKKYEEQIKHFAFHDIVTDLPNRRKLTELVKEIINDGKEKHLAIIFLDLDFFKLVNDNYGHDVGDKLLKEVANRLYMSLPKNAVTSRIGGDEFVIAVPNLEDKENAGIIAQSIKNAFKLPFICQQKKIHITASIGISLYPEDSVEISTLINRADQAMYWAKRNGKNNYQFYADNETKRDEFTVMDLHTALTENQFKLVYQPKLSIETKKIEAVEALLRWEHPIYGTISPDQFIPLAEETSLIIPIGEWVLKEACNQVKKLEKSGLSPVRVAVNISPKQFASDTILQTINRVLNETNLDPTLLELEITERITMKDIHYVTKMLREIDELGVKIALDDFGIGYSSLNYLKNFPIDLIKIDKSFIRDCVTSEKDAFIIKAIITMAKGLNVKVLAEGVETKEQFKLVSLLGCNEIQGYFFSKPLPSGKLASLLKSRGT